MALNLSIFLEIYPAVDDWFHIKCGESIYLSWTVNSGQSPIIYQDAFHKFSNTNDRKQPENMYEMFVNKVST